jgi:hypothetical protein
VLLELTGVVMKKTTLTRVYGTLFKTKDLTEYLLFT